MKDTITDSFNGVINIGSGEGYNAFFNVDGHVVKILPLTKECGDTVFRMSRMDGKGPADDSQQWLYGFTEDNCSVAILKNSRFRVGHTSGCDMRIAQFYTPIIAKSTNHGMKVDLSTFDAIEFYGGIMDIIHNPDQAIEYNGNSIAFKSIDNYTREYNVEIDGENFEVKYSISTEELSMDLGKLPDLRGAIHSTLRFSFQSPRMLMDVLKYYSYAMSLFQFCTGRLNVCSEVRLYKKENNCPILLCLNDSFDDYANNLDCTEVIRLGYLDRFLPSLLKLLNEDRTKPHLNFLPMRNKDVNSIMYTNVNDLCIAFEIEYSRSIDTSLENERSAAKKLTEVLLDVIEKREDCPETVKNKAKAILNTQLKDFTPSLKEKIVYICERYHQYVTPLTEPFGHDSLGISTVYSSKEFQEKIAKFVKIRNSASHSKIVWNDGIDIFCHLKLYIYFSVLKRTGIPPESIRAILSWMYGRLF